MVNMQQHTHAHTHTPRINVVDLLDANPEAIGKNHWEG